jgi:hypothetical protein
MRNEPFRRFSRTNYGMGKFKLGEKRPAKAGIKKGQKQTAPLIKRRVEEILAFGGVDLVADLLKDIAQIEKPEARANVRLKLMEYVYPKLSAQAVTVDDQRDSEQGEVIDVTPKTTEELLEIANDETKEGK